MQAPVVGSQLTPGGQCSQPVFVPGGAENCQKL